MSKCEGSGARVTGCMLKGRMCPFCGRELFPVALEHHKGVMPDHVVKPVLCKACGGTVSGGARGQLGRCGCGESGG